ncbi:hypothetical protein M2282_000101 [Variovorax boronicumulans]|uniref:hypothetical protein n=1 Tax=Variovorax boronicumulans TaxID=436515 RepID=UPI0024731959|nr:hypothetical protein [Variovorax boronicumulans]MDH6164973.1 hypothetical protein [Variovorax boronicumulans]
MNTAAANPDAFLALLSCGLITDAQHDAVLAHPETATLPPIPGPAHALAWMCVKGLVTQEEIDAAVERLEEASPPLATADDAAEVAYDAEEFVELGDRGITHEAVNALFNNGLVDAETRDMALEETPLVGSVPAAPAATLAWMVIEGPLDKELFEATRAEVAAEPAFAMAADRARIVAEAQEEIAADEKAVGAWRATAQGKRRRGAWTSGLVTLAIVGGLGWYLFTPAGVPACNTDATRKTLQGLMLRVSIDARTQGLREVGIPTLSGLREVGYRKDERIRGCMATMTRGDETRSIAYTIGPASAKNDNDGDEMTVRGADPVIVEARFGNLDTKGKPLYNAEPIGRAAAEKAFRDGVTALQSSSPAAAMLQRQLERQRARQRSTTGLVVTDADREREIADFEPTGPCRVHEDGASRVCPLVVEYNDSLLATIGRTQSLPLTGEFTFVQDNGNWRMSDDFAKRFTRAVTEARLIGLGVTDAVAAPE